MKNNYLSVKAVQPQDDYCLLLTFETGEQKIFDMKPYLNKGIFKKLKDKKLFEAVRISFDSIEWPNKADFDPEVLYEEGKDIS